MARDTEGYSGSDLRSFCAEVAMIAAIELTNRARSSDSNKRRKLTKLHLEVSHFEKALRKIRPTVSQDTIIELEGFTKQFNA